LDRALRLEPGCAEALFWRGLCHLRAGQSDTAQEALSAAHREGGLRFVDPPLYLGALLLQRARAPEGVRYLAEANRVDASCPLVPWRRGRAIVAAGGESRLAVQALQRALGPRGLGLWRGTAADPDRRRRLWVEALPEGRSFVRRLALKHPFTCPLLGNDVEAMHRQGQLAPGQAHYRLGHFQEAADVFHRLMQESPPTLPLLRGYGLSLARLDRYDDAFKHLRAAFDLDPKDHVVAGYLALCGALG